MSSTASRHTDDPVPTPPVEPDGKLDLFAPATPVVPGQASPARPDDPGREPPAPGADGTGRHARRAADPTGPAAADPVAGVERGTAAEVEAPRPVPAVPLQVPPPVPSPVFDVPEVRVRERHEVTAPAPPPLHRDPPPPGTGSGAGPGPARSGPLPAPGGPGTTSPAAGRDRPDVARTVPRPAPAGPVAPSPARPTAGGGPAGRVPTPRPVPVPPAEEAARPTRPVRMRRPAPPGPGGPPPGQAGSPGMPPLHSSSTGLPRVRPAAPFPPAYGSSPGMVAAYGSSPGIAPPAHATSPEMVPTPGTSSGMPVRPAGPPGAAPPPPPPPPQPSPSPAPRRDRSSGTGAPWGDGPARRTARFALHLVTTTRATRELAELADAAQRPVTTGRRIAVVSVRGGAGRSAVTALLGSVFAARRADHVLVADADPDHGSLAWRLGVESLEPLGPLAPRLIAARGIAELDTVLPRTAGGLWMLPGAVGAAPGLIRDVTRALSRFFAICVTDCGRGLETPGTVDVLQDAHAAVVVAPATPDGVRSTRVGLTRMPAALLSRTVVVLATVDRGGRAALDLAATREALAGAGAGIPVVTLPYDRHLAAGTTISPKRLAEATTIEATRLAGHVLRRAADRTRAAGTGPR